MHNSVALFFALATQWKWIGAGMAGAFRSGLDYTAVQPVATMLGLDLTPRVFNDLRIMESAAIEIWSRQR